MKPFVIVPVFNEEDILPWTIDHLQKQGCEVYVLDNWSTDHSGSIAGAFRCGYERWPEEKTNVFDLTGMLTRVEEIALAHPGRWVMLNDADEIRRARNTGITLAEGFKKAKSEGSNAIKFEVFTFCPVDNTYVGDPENHFRYFSVDHIASKMTQVKAWFQYPHQCVDIHSIGGHYPVFPGCVVHPEAFVLKHYPIRSQQHGERKVLRERLPRYMKVELAKNWHVHYNEFRDGRTNFLRDAKELTEWPKGE